MGKAVPIHAAPDGAWVILASRFYKHAAPTELPMISQLTTASCNLLNKPTDFFL